MAGNTAEGLTGYTIKGTVVDDKGGAGAGRWRSIGYGSWCGKHAGSRDEEGGYGVEKLNCCCGDFYPGAWFELSLGIA